MKTIRVISADEVGGTDGSGLTGPADIPEIPRQPGERGARARLRGARAVLHGTVAGFPRVLRLSLAASPSLTTGLGASTVLAGLAPAASAWIIGLLVNTVVAAARGAPAVRLPLLPAVTPAAAAVILIGAQLVVTEGNVLATACGDMCRQLLQDKMTLHVQATVMTQAQRLDLSFFEDSASYDLLRQAAQETPVRSVTMISGAFGLVQTLVTFASMAGLLVALNPLLALIALVAPLPAFTSEARYGKQGYLVALLTSPVRRRMQYLSDLLATDSYVKEVKLFGLAPFLIKRYGLLASAFYRRLRRLVTRRASAGAAWISISTVAGTLTYGYVALAAISGRLSLGDMTLYATAALSVQASLQALFSGLGAMY